MSWIDRPPQNPTRLTFRVRRNEASLSEAEQAVLKIVVHRIREFQKTFGRTPVITDPLLFVEESMVPLQASADEAIQQLKEAARACGVDFEILRDVLGIWEL